MLFQMTPQLFPFQSYLRFACLLLRRVVKGVTLSKYEEVYLPCEISMTSRDSNELSAAAGFSTGGVYAAFTVYCHLLPWKCVLLLALQPVQGCTFSKLFSLVGVVLQL